VTDPDAAARRYHRRRLLLSIASVTLGAAILVAWLASGAAVALVAWLAERLPARALVVAAMAMAVGGSTTVVTFPLSVLGGFVLPRRAGLLHQSGRGWLADQAKGLALGGALGLAAVELVYALLAWSPAWWWLWSALLVWGGAVLLTAVLPVWIVPLFYRLVPLEDRTLRDRLLALARRAGVTAAEISVLRVSEKERTANAGVVGLGRTRRILVADTLLTEFAPEEIEVVLAHELAHHARGHLPRSLAIQLGVFGVDFAVVDAALERLAGGAGLSGPADPAGLPLLALVFGALGLLTTPLLAAWSRRLEREADADALAVTRAPAAFVAAMERLARLNLAERRPGRLKEWLFATHPSIDSRIALARAAERQPAGAVSP
jgi:STE24 endopeptidase